MNGLIQHPVGENALLNWSFSFPGFSLLQMKCIISDVISRSSAIPSTSHNLCSLIIQHKPTCSKLPTNISHLMHTFPPGCCSCVNMLLTETRGHYGAHVPQPPDVSIKNYSRTTLSADIDSATKGVGGGGGYRFQTCLDLSAFSKSPKSNDWQAIQWSWSKKKRAIITSIIRHSHMFLHPWFCISPLPDGLCVALRSIFL